MGGGFGFVSSDLPTTQQRYDKLVADDHIFADWDRRNFYCLYYGQQRKKFIDRTSKAKSFCRFGKNFVWALCLSLWSICIGRENHCKYVEFITQPNIALLDSGVNCSTDINNPLFGSIVSFNRIEISQIQRKVF